MAVPVSDEESFTVRGVGPNDIMHVYYRHVGAISTAFDKLADRYRQIGEVGQTDVSALIAGIVEDAPTVVAEIIAIASGSDPTAEAEFEEDVKLALSLSFGTTVSALEKIGQLTFTTEMPAGKFFALIARMVPARLGETAAPSDDAN